MSNLQAVQAYLNAIEDEYGDRPITHENTDGSPAGYFYWSDREDLSQLCSVVDASWLYDNGHLTWDSQEQCWDLEGTRIPAEYDFRKIRRRLEDALRKTTNESLLLRLALNLDVKID